ncbi:unnamed protein product, partial [marine sediment metagenome]
MIGFLQGAVRFETLTLVLSMLQKPGKHLPVASIL